MHKVHRTASTETRAATAKPGASNATKANHEATAVTACAAGVKPPTSGDSGNCSRAPYMPANRAHLLKTPSTFA